jgi:hypothetical protein
MNGGQPESEVKKAKTLVITGEDGKQYHPLVVPAEETQHESLEIPKPDFLLVHK